MGVTFNFNSGAGADDIQAYLEKEAKKHMQRVKTALQLVGEEVVNGIRSGALSNWNDHTGNLRSSIGYVVAIDGTPVLESPFEQVAGPENEGATANGGEEGRAYARSIASLYPEGISLVVVAGMEYASYVEALENKTVLAQGEIEARRLVREMIAELEKRYNSTGDDD